MDEIAVGSMVTLPSADVLKEIAIDGDVADRVGGTNVRVACVDWPLAGFRGTDGGLWWVALSRFTTPKYAAGPKDDRPLGPREQAYADRQAALERKRLVQAQEAAERKKAPIGIDVVAPQNAVGGWRA